MKFIKLLQTIVISVALLVFGSVLFYKISQSSLTDFPGSAKAYSPAFEKIYEQSSEKEEALDSGVNQLTISDDVSDEVDNYPIEITGAILPGDSFDSSLQRLDISSQLRHQIIAAFSNHLDFTHLDTKDKYYLRFDQDGTFLNCLYEAGPLESYLLKVNYDGISVEKNTVRVETKTVKISGEIDSSLFGAFSKLDEQPKLIYAFADIFSSKLDFNTETQKGDQFSIIIDKYYRDNNFIGYGKIKLAEYTKSNGQKMRGYYYSSADIVGAYFDEEGKEVGTSFLRSPVPMGRLTSKFTYRRKHPITGRVKAHLGIDLAAPVGTPILAASDGKIISLGRNGLNGKQIIIAHNGGYKTYYGHLSGYKKGLNKGSYVKKKDVIGYVGSSGLSTGPHLDYRIKHNDVFENPFSLKLQPKSELSKSEQENFNVFVSKMNDVLTTTPDEPTVILEAKSLVLTPDRTLNFL